MCVHNFPDHDLLCSPSHNTHEHLCIPQSRLVGQTSTIPSLTMWGRHRPSPVSPRGADLNHPQSRHVGQISTILSLTMWGRPRPSPVPPRGADLDHPQSHPVGPTCGAFLTSSPRLPCFTHLLSLSSAEVQSLFIKILSKRSLQKRGKNCFLVL